MEITQVASTTSFEHQQQQVAKNKRKKFNPKFMLTNSSSDDEGDGSMEKDDDDDLYQKEINKDSIGNASCSEDEEHGSGNGVKIAELINDKVGQNNNNNNDSPPPPAFGNPFLSPTKSLSFLQKFGSLQQQQQIFQQAAISAIAPQLSQQLSASMNLSETEAKFREFAFKTMQELLNIYGLSLSTSDIVDALKQQHVGQASPSASTQSTLEPPTPPRTPIQNQLQQQQRVSSEKIYNNNNEDAKENSLRNTPVKSAVGVSVKALKSEAESDYEDYHKRSHFNDDSNNYSDDERGGRQSAASLSLHMNGIGDDSDHEESDYASSFDSSKLSLKNVESLIDKSSPVNFYNPMMQLTNAQNDPAEKQLIAEYSKYLTKYQSYVDCHNEQCQNENQREHYHCYDIQCSNKMLNKKEEIIRHLKWHKKRSESLSHGFLRFTSSDDCSIQFGYCQHNRKQTHYHCIQARCDKTYISTSDVQMHSNYHRKDSQIYQEGFHRYRATEKCMVQHCIFYGQCTTHFHCRRCKYTFKNKADMEKHKTYHMKDEQLLKDGFKKFLKTEPCRVEGCRFTMICNHIHCVRSNCTYVLHSSGQLLSHKRKHERIDAEMAYRRFKMGHTAKDLTESELSALQSFHGLDLAPKPPPPPTLNQFPVADQATTDKFNKLLNNATMENLNVLLSHTAVEQEKNIAPELLRQIQERQMKFQQQQQANGHESPLRHDNEHNGSECYAENGHGDEVEDGIPKSVIQSLQQQQHEEPKAPTIEEVEQIINQYFTDQCTKQQQLSNEPLDLNVKTSSSANKSLLECFMSNNESHLHCLITGCEAVVPRNLKDISEHLRMHELNRGADSIIQNSNLLQITSIEGFFNRKRGRPPKNRVVEVYNNTHHPPQAIFTSFKLERNDQNSKGHSSTASSAALNQSQATNQNAYANQKSKPVKREPSPSESGEFVSRIEIVQSSEKCCDTSCVYQRLLHYHCNFSKFCHFSTNQLVQMDLHLNDFHTKMEIMENYEYFDRNYDCKLNGCCYNKISAHFHCILCKFSFSMPMEMTEHVCEENIEESYESFDISESDLMKARPQPLQPTTAQRFLEQTLQMRPEKFDERSMIQKINESFFNHENKVALNSDVDLIKTPKVAKSISTSSGNSDKVAVVRASGTWVPQNTNSDYESPTKAATVISSPQDLGKSQLNCDDDATCDRPFCKLKRKKHEHCDLCNQGFTDAMKLKIHYLKHQQTKLGGMFDDSNDDSKSDAHLKKEELEPHDLSKASAAALPNLMFPMPHSSANPAPGVMDSLSLQNLQLANLAQLYQQNSLYYHSLYPIFGNQPPLGMDQQMPLMQFPFPAAAALASAGGGFDFGGLALPNMKSSLLAQKRKLEQLDELQNLQKKAKLSERPKEYQKKTYKDDSVPTGYLKFRFNQDCNFPNCGYRNHQSHFHCCRKDCFYSFCDKTRFVQHTARHERLDKLMGDDFKQFRANMHCGYQNCAYNKNIGPHNKSSHFHCLKCNYICSDTNKVVAHRRQHSKQEYINKAGFRKYTNNEACMIADPFSPDGECLYTLKQTHYHCLVCQMGVLSRNQLSFHTHRIRPGMSTDDFPPEMMNSDNIFILNDNGSDENSS